MRIQGGQTLVIFALTLVFFFTGMLALVADLGALFIAYNRVDDAALLASQAGASAIDQGAFYGGHVRLDPGIARRRCQESLTSAGVPGSCSVDVDVVTADAGQLVKLPVPVLGLSAPVHVQHRARPAFGGRAAGGVT
jgi:hypothetical protein